MTGFPDIPAIEFQATDWPLSPNFSCSEPNEIMTAFRKAQVATERLKRGRLLNGSNFLEGWQSRHTAFGIEHWPRSRLLVGGLLPVGKALMRLHYRLHSISPPNLLPNYYRQKDEWRKYKRRAYIIRDFSIEMRHLNRVYLKRIEPEKPPQEYSPH